jgi:predicted AlkP superfamily pyrophosphatase or phosphodiesterase
VRAALARHVLAAGILGVLLVPWAGHAEAEEKEPQLVVVVSIDQFPRQLLDRTAALLPKGGFRRLLEEGADYVQCDHGHFPTYTGPGHAVMLTGAYPMYNGIVGNSWYSRARASEVGCVADAAFPIVGEPEGTPVTGGVSPRNLLGATVGDVLRSATEMRSKVVSVSLKDRAAVLLGGQRPNGAYWFDPATCRFVTSTYYAARLPDWVERLDAKDLCAEYVGKTWSKLRTDFDYATYASPDDEPFERDYLGLGRVFPHPIAEQKDNPAGRYAALVATPLANQLVARFAREAVSAEDLGGGDGSPDILAISFSSNDYVGHLFGPNSQEVLDATLRTDRVLADLMDFLDRAVGADEWTLVVTSDHGVAPVPELLESEGLLAARDDHHRIDIGAARARVEKALRGDFFGTRAPPASFAGFVAAWDEGTEPYVYLRRDAVAHLPGHVSFAELLRRAQGEIEKQPGVLRVYRSDERDALAASSDVFAQRAFRGWQPQNGGDLLVQTEPYWLTGAGAATSHGTPYSYDTHVPLLLYGAGIRAGRYARPVGVVDLAPTLARLLGVNAPPQNQGEPLFEALQ